MHECGVFIAYKPRHDMFHASAVVYTEWRGLYINFELGTYYLTIIVIDNYALYSVHVIHDIHYHVYRIQYDPSILQPSPSPCIDSNIFRGF